MCGGGDSARAQAQSQALAKKQFEWQKDQAHQVKVDAANTRHQMDQGLIKIDKRFDRFNPSYYEGIADQYRNYANPQIEKAQGQAEFGLQSALANRGKLGSSTDARQSADLVSTYGGIYRDSELKAQEHANNQRAAVASAKQTAIGQMYASESQNAGLQAAGGAVRSLNSGPSYEPITALLSQASKFAALDYGNSLYNGKSNGLFSPLFSQQASQATANPATSGGDVKNYNGA